jgi:nuclear pore complex protein Nup188
VVKKKLLGLQKEIEDGIKIFKRPKSDAAEEVEKLLKEKQHVKLIPFAHKLQRYLDLDVKQSYEILCYYLVNEYRGSASSLQNFVSNESLMTKLLNDIWFYYTLERMVLLKVVKCMLEYHESPDHPYQQAFKAVIDKIGLTNLRKSYIAQFELILKDIQHVKFLTGDIFNSPQKLQSWSERKHRELNEILQIILLTSYFDTMQADEIQNLLDLFKTHSFGKQNQFLSASNSAHMDLIQRITYNEIAVLVVALSTSGNDDNSDWMNEVIDKLDEKIIAMHHYQEHGPILLSWMIFKFSSKKSDTTTNDQFNNYGKLGARAVQLNVFEYLHKMITHKQFMDKSLISKVFLRCVYENLVILCDLFNTDGSLAQHPKIFELFSEVLKLPSIAKDFCKNEDSPARTLFNSAVEKFPHDFVPLSLLARSLSAASVASNNWIVHFLQNLPVYTEQPNDPLYELRKSDDNETDSYALLNDYQPFRRINEFIIKADNSAVVREEKGKMFVYFIIKLNYFHALQNEIHELLNCIVSYAEIQETTLSRLEAGISLLATIVKRIDSPDDITNEMIHPTEMVFDVLEKFKVFQHPSLDLMAACLNVCAELVTNFGEEVFRRFINLNIAPVVNAVHRDFKTYSNGNGFELGLVGYYLINIERSSGRYNFLRAYFNFLKKCNKVRLNNNFFSFLNSNHNSIFLQLEIGDVYAIELPGLLLIVREVFNNIHTWYFENEQERMEILLFVFEYVHDILSIPNEVIKEDLSKKLLRDICVYSLLYLDNASSLLRYVAIGNAALQNFMENESNWFFAADSQLNLLVINAMRILMQTLRLKETVAQNMEMLAPLEQMIYTQPKQRDALKIIPIVANYTTYSFNRRFAVLSCRLLRRFAIEFQSSLSACLDLEADQIRMMFLQRLRDDLESDDLKISILDFVNACIDKQPGLTEAFFKVSYEQDARSSYFFKRSEEDEDSCDGIITYMEEFLEAVSKDPTKITNDQLKRIMNLFHALWKQGLQSLVSSLLKKDTFWFSLCSPILTTPISNYQYSQLLNIMGIELFKLREVTNENENFMKMVEKFLSKDVFQKWLRVVFELPNMSLNDSSIIEEIPEWLGRLQSFKDFLVLLLKKKSIINFPSDCNKMLLDKSLEALEY